MGLGLSLAKMLTGRMGGQIGVDHLGTGSRFWFSLPMVLADSLPAPPAPAARPSSAESLRLLIVEDNSVNMTLILRLLRSLGCAQQNLVTAVDGKEAFELANKQQFDLIVMDCRMPVMDGWQATELIRQQSKLNRSTLVCAVTASSTQVERDQCFSSGMNRILLKPFTRSQLEELLRWAHESATAS
jgi:CheY-like chemotaxis protein